MRFSIESKGNENIHKYPTEDRKLAERFTDELHNELKDFLLGVIMFGSSVRRETSERSDIDILVVTDDTEFQISPEMVETYKIIVEKLVVRVSPKLHVTSMSYTSFWDHTRAGDPVVVNILRDGVPLYDSGFFTPLQRLLKLGKIRATEESVWKYYGRAPKTLMNSRWHILQACLDLYWAVIDSAHAALMRKNELPPTPEHVAHALELIYVRPRLLEKKYAKTMEKFFDLQKKITHREIRMISGQEYEKLYEEADAFVKRMKLLVQKKF